MTKLNLAIPNYNQAETNLSSLALGVFINQHPLIGRLSVLDTRHKGITRITSEGLVLDYPQLPQTQIFNIQLKTIRNFDVGIYLWELSEAGRAIREATARDFYAQMDRDIEAAGNVFDFRGKSIFDAINDFLEDDTIYFDKNNNPILPEFVSKDIKTNEILSKLQRTKQQQERFESILEGKRLDYYAKKRTRKLS